VENGTSRWIGEVESNRGPRVERRQAVGEEQCGVWMRGLGMIGCIKWAFLLAGLNIWFGPIKILVHQDSNSAQ